MERGCTKPKIESENENAYENRARGGQRKATKMHINSSDNAGEEGEEEQSKAVEGGG